MSESLIKFIFIFLVGTSVLNFLIAVIARLKTGHKDFNILVLYWPTLIFTYFAAAILSQSPTEIAFAYFFQVLSSNFVSKMLADSQGIKLKWKNYIGLQMLTIGLSSFLLLKTELGFTYSLLPVCLAFTAPFITPITRAIFTNRKNSNWVEKSLAWMMITGVLNHFNYAFFRLDESTAAWGWSISIAQYQCLSLFLPLLINLRREEKEKNNIKKALEKISGRDTSTHLKIDDLYQNLEFQIAQKDSFYKQLQSSNKNLEEEREINEILIRTISHDLANPLTVIHAYSDMIQSKRIQPHDYDKAISRIRSNSESAIQMIERIRTAILTRNQASYLSIKRVSLNHVLESLQEMFENRLKEKELKLKVNFSQAHEMLVEADENALRDHILANILSNAIKFSYPGSEIHINLQESSAHVQVEVRDFGTGIKKRRLQKRLDSTPGTNGESGAGFGLMVMSYFVRKLDASFEITTYDKDTSGTSVILTLPKSQMFQSVSTAEVLTANLSS
jgi:signal transduction histidine kinase